MTKRIAYLGDTALTAAAAYLAGIMSHYDLPFDYVPPSRKPAAKFFGEDYGLYVLSDYPSARFSPQQLEKLCARVRAGAGLLMFGGWESYRGLEGFYNQTPLAELLPVRMLDTDDRRNWSQLILMRQAAAHPILEGLPFDRPAGVGGYNEVEVKPGATVLLEGEIYAISIAGEKVDFRAQKRIPLLVVDERGPGRIACLTTDVAPHWVGGFVDWGQTRVTAGGPGREVEVGADYARFFGNLLKWGLRTER